MIIKGITEEDFVNYKSPSFFIAFPTCTFKCCRDCGQDVCQNSTLAKANDIKIDAEKLCARYIANDITKAVVCGGLEPLDSREDLLDFISCLRNQFNCEDDVVIYTGYNKDEIEETFIDELRQYKNIIIKWGRFVPDQEAHLDNLLGVVLKSPNQYSERLS